MSTHDGAYKHIFSHAQIVRDLLTGFVRESWVGLLDLDTLELTKNSYVTDDLRDRADDLVWRVRTREGGDWLYVYLLIEFQSRVDPWMALRILVYTGLLYQDLVKSGQVRSGQRLPPVFPVVIYNGDSPWSAGTELAELIEPLPGLKAYRPSQRHLVLDEGRLDEDEIAAGNNALAEMIRLERSPTPTELQAIVARLTRRLAEPRHDSLRRALVVWLNRVVLRRLVPGERIDEVHDLQEMGAMLAERVVEWTENWKQQGLQEGRLKGRQEGRLKGEAAVLTRLLTRRFGPLDASVRSRLDQATLEELERWSDRILDAATLDEIFA